MRRRLSEWKPEDPEAEEDAVLVGLATLALTVSLLYLFGLH
jgi:hypothetical protein